jgi:tRNA (guanine37-N1)-methyltransferase
LRKRLRDVIGDSVVGGGAIKSYNSFDIVGDIAITRLPDLSIDNAKEVARAILDSNRGVKAVFAQISPVNGPHRIRRLAYVAGENKTTTIHKEWGCTFKVDIKNCYFSPRLSFERQRIAMLVQPGEKIVNMFAGVGCFSLVIAKRVPSSKVYSIDINPNAVKLMEENIRANRVYGQVIPLLGDSKALIEKQLYGSADRVLMPLPEKAFEYLSAAVLALKPAGGWIHIHAFEHLTKTKNPIDFFRKKLEVTGNDLFRDFQIASVRLVRSTGPNWCQLVADMHVS